MAAIPFPDTGDWYPWATTATSAYVFYVNPDTCDSTYPVMREMAEFIPGRRQPIWEDEPRVAKRFILKHIATKCRVLRRIATSPSRCQVRREKRRMYLQS